MVGKQPICPMTSRWHASMIKLSGTIGRVQKNQRYYKNLKICVIGAAALIPLLSGLRLSFAFSEGMPSWVLGALGAGIAVLEGI